MDNKFPKIGTYENGWKRVSFLRIDVSQGYKFPRGYGMAYLDWQTGKAVSYPLFINWLVWVGINFYWKLLQTPITKHEQEIYQAGYAAGKHDNE